MSTGPLPLHPMGLGDVLDGAFKLFRANARSVLLIAAIFVGPVHLIAAFAQRTAYGGGSIVTFINNSSTTQSRSDGASTVAVLVSAGATLFVLPFVAGAVSRVVAASYLGGQLTPGPALRVVGRRWWALVVAWLLVHVVELVAGVFCVFPGLLAMALFVATAPAIAIEELGPIRGMRRSASLVRPRLFPVLGIALLAGLMANVLGSVLGFVPQTVAFVIGLRWGWILLAAGSSLSAIATTPFVAIVATLLYFDGRIRNEGLDLELIAAHLAEP